MSALTSQNIVEELEKHKGPLSAILQVEHFAEPGKLADQLAKGYRDRLKATQLRRFFHTIKNIERTMRGKKDTDNLPSETRSKLLPLMPELAYARGRGLIPQDFYNLMKACLSSHKLQTVGDFRLLTQFLTAILAYHKFYTETKSGGQR